MFFLLPPPWDQWRNWTLLVGRDSQQHGSEESGSSCCHAGIFCLARFRMPEIALTKLKRPSNLFASLNYTVILIISKQKVRNCQGSKVHNFSCFVLFISFVAAFLPSVFSKKGPTVTEFAWIFGSFPRVLATCSHKDTPGYTIHDSWLTKDVGGNDDPTSWSGNRAGELFLVAKLRDDLRSHEGVPACKMLGRSTSNKPTGGDYGYVLPKYLTLDSLIQQEAKLRPHLTSRISRMAASLWIGMVPVVSRCGESCHHLVGPQIPGQQKSWLVKRVVCFGAGRKMR